MWLYIERGDICPSDSLNRTTNNAALENSPFIQNNPWGNRVQGGGVASKIVIFDFNLINVKFE